MATKTIKIDDKGHTIDIAVNHTPDGHIITVDGVEWATVPNQMHAAVIYNMFADHITEYVNFEPLK